MTLFLGQYNEQLQQFAKLALGFSWMVEGHETKAEKDRARNRAQR